MRTFRFAFLFLVLASLITCVPFEETKSDAHPPETIKYNHPDFDFSYPSDWQLMSELWPNYQAEKNYKNLGVVEQANVTSVQNQGESGAWCTIAIAASSGDLKTFVDRTYAETVPEIEDVSESSISVGDDTGFEICYRRPWGEPWWEFRDVWLEKNGNVYLLSCHALSLDQYQDDMNTIINSFSGK